MDISRERFLKKRYEKKEWSVMKRHFIRGLLYLKIHLFCLALSKLFMYVCFSMHGYVNCTAFVLILSLYSAT